jgi:hypothetical protein
MKTLKIFSIILLLATAMVNTAKADEPKVLPNAIAINITFQQAIQDPGLVAAMHKQLTGGFLGGPGVHYITLRVNYNNHVYLITGSIDEWTLFFNCSGFTTEPKPHYPSIGNLKYQKPYETL